jgi:hypothetical protein
VLIVTRGVFFFLASDLAKVAVFRNRSRLQASLYFFGFKIDLARELDANSKFLESLF